MTKMFPVMLLAATLAPSIEAQKDAKSLQAGKKIYIANCISCHGADGSASTGMGRGLGVPDFRQTLSSRKPAEIREVIENGRGAMPAWKTQLKPAQIAQVTAYVKSLAKK